MAAIVLAGVTTAAMVVSPMTALAGQPKGWADTSLKVVGGPIVADGELLVVDVSSGRDLQLSELDASTGGVRWSHEISASYIPPVVVLDPVVVGGTALILVPADGNAIDPNAVIEGVDIASGRVKWRDKPTLIATDAPVACASEKDFCVAAFTSNNASTSLALIDPSTGRIQTTVSGPALNLGLAQPGSSYKGDLWSTYGTLPMLVQLSSSGKREWEQSLAKVFGGKQYNPYYGWDFVVRGGLDVGSVGYPTTGDKWSLDEFKTVGLAVSSGKVEWDLPGFYMCGGTLQFLSTDVVCRFAGTVTENGLQFSGLGVTFEGIDPASGRVTWSERVADPTSVVEAASQPFLDGRHLVVETSTGKWAVLDTFDGSTSPVLRGEVFWCERQPGYKVTTPKGASQNGQRGSTAVFTGCSANGTPVKGLPSTQPAAVGVEDGSLYVWLTPSGLRAVPLAASPSA